MRCAPRIDHAKSVFPAGARGSQMTALTPVCVSTDRFFHSTAEATKRIFDSNPGRLKARQPFHRCRSNARADEPASRQAASKTSGAINAGLAAVRQRAGCYANANCDLTGHGRMLGGAMRLYAFVLVASLPGLLGCHRRTIDAVDGSTDRSVPSDATSGDTAPGDAALGDAGPDGARIPCGSTTCAASEICLYPPCGCIAFTDPMTDAGDCPDGETYFDALGSCFAPPQCQPPSCVSPAPGTGSFDCSEPDGGTGCSTVNAPIPERCGHICRSICL
jgi:hypothetical protein